MVKPSPLNPLSYIIDRQYNENIVIKNQIFKQRLANARNLFRKDLLAHYGCVNAIEFSNEGDLLVSGGDDRRVLLWCVPEAMFGRRPPVVMETNHNSNIFCLGFDSGNTKIFSGGNDDQVIIHDAITGNLVGKLPHKKPVYGLSLNPQNNYVIATAGDDGRILLFDVRESSNSDAVCLAKKKTGFHSVMFNPTNPRWLTTANSDEGIALWDCRKPKELLIHYDANAGPISGISACFNSDGTRVLALRRRLPPVLYATERENAICQFYHPQYYNSCTMKTCCFAGDNDEYILSGSDDFNLYMWRIPENDSIEWGRSHLVLHGHRSIVNQVRYNKTNNLIASSGVEKMVKLWSTLSIGTWKGSLIKDHTDLARTVYSHEEYIHIVGHSGERISHDYSDHSTQEDSKMMAFFDSLIQREIEGWETSENSDYSDSDSDDHERNLQIILNEMFLNCKLPPDDHKKFKTNRIAQLIAKKRARLAKMAHEKSSTTIQGNYLKEKNKKKKTTQKSSKFKKHNGINKKSLQTSRHIEKDKHKSTINERNNINNNNNKLRKYRTRQSIKDELLYESNSSSSTSNNSFDAPSTSTGITSSNNSVYRLIEQDSDEDLPTNHNNNINNNSNDNSNNNCLESNSNNDDDDDDDEEEDENNFVNILPTPLNGTHDMYINVLEMTSSNGNVVTLRNEEYNRASTTTTTNNEDIDDCNTIASTSNNKRRLRCYNNNNNNNSFYGDTESDSDYEFDYCTPIKKRRTISASDSGCGTSGPCSSTSPYPYNHNHTSNNKRNCNSNNNNNHQECSNNNNNNNNNNLYNNNDHSSDDEINYEKFKKRINKARLNIRKQIAGADSDSN